MADQGELRLATGRSSAYRRGRTPGTRLRRRRMASHSGLSRRSFLMGSGVGVAVVLGGGTSSLLTAGPAWAAPTGALYQAALAKGIRYGSSTATWQVQPDPAYAAI